MRLDTNGQFTTDLIFNSSFNKLDNLGFSIDGHIPEINDPIRGNNTYDRCVRMIRKAVELGYYTTVTVCVHKKNMNTVDQLIAFATELGVKEINFHPLFIMGVERDKFTGGDHIRPNDWISIYQNVRKNIEKGVYKIHVRIPQRFVEKSTYQKDVERYGYCPVRMGERILVHPDGKIRICALCIGSPYFLASYNREEIKFGAPDSEISKERLERRPCMTQTKDFGNFVPLCISYKPYQNEHVWQRGAFDNNFQAFYK